MADKVLTVDQVRKALSVDDDFDSTELDRYASLASAFVKQKTRYNFATDTVVHPLAVQLATLYCRQQYYNGAGDYNKDHDYTIGISSLIIDLQCVADSKKAAKVVYDLIALIPGTVTLSDEPKIVAARTAYDQLFDQDLEYVSNYSTLVAAEAALLVLR
ncbi:MAG: hypothetical protein A2Y16_05405 [Tenericutes bacterium GWF2_57_13]|nr:MAG: hypothetical protein A2Y16_05405 [Tenericutes bacterium GWF2_57_13]